MGVLYDSGPYGILTFLFLSIALGGAASMATGRALAVTWRPLWHCALYAAPIALTIAFLHYALVEESVISLEALRDSLAEMPDAFGAGLSGLLWALRGAAVLFVIHTSFSMLGYRLTRARQMSRQYGFAFDAAGPLGWRSRLRRPLPSRRA